MTRANNESRLSALCSSWLDEADRLDSAIVGEPSVLDRIASDPANVMRLAGFEPDSWQAEFLRAIDSDIMILAGRQIGKSHATAGKALQVALTQPDSLVVVVSRSQDQANELYRKIMRMYNLLGRPVAKANDMSSELHLRNDSRIVPKACTTEGILGYTARLLILDEGAVMPDALYLNARPLLATGGQLIVLSSPFGKRGWFYHEWAGIDEAGEPVEMDSWRRFGPIRSDQCGRIKPSFLEKERKGPRGIKWYRQSYECSWEDAEDATFLQEHIDRAMSGNFDPLVLPGDGIVESVGASGDFDLLNV